MSVDEGAVRRPAAIVLVPTRELAMQIEDTCKQLMRGNENSMNYIVWGILTGLVGNFVALK